MKKIFLIITSFVSVICLAQREKYMNLQGFEDKRFNWGYYLGVSNWDFKLDPITGLGTSGNKTTIDNKGGLGLSVGLMGMINLTQNVDVRIEPGMHFVTRKLTFNNDNIPVAQQEVNVKSTYLEIPLLVHFRGNRWNNVRPFIAAGAGYMRNLQSNEKAEDDNTQGTFRMRTNNYNWQGEAGVEIYFRHFKMTPSVKGIFVINNEIVPDNETSANYWAGSIDGLRSRALMVSLKFE